MQRYTFREKENYRLLGDNYNEFRTNERKQWSNLKPEQCNGAPNEKKNVRSSLPPSDGRPAYNFQENRSHGQGNQGLPVTTDDHSSGYCLMEEHAVSSHTSTQRGPSKTNPETHAHAPRTPMGSHTADHETLKDEQELTQDDAQSCMVS